MQADLTLRELLEVGAEEIRSRREATLLLSAVAGLDLAQLHLRGDDPVPPELERRYRQTIRDRARGVPFQIITGTTEFHDVTLRMEPGVFIPRPETELLVEEAREAITARTGPVAVLDLGTGSGAIAVALAVAFRGREEVTVYAGDRDGQAVCLARENAERNGVDHRIDVRESDLFSAFSELAGTLDLVVSNPPYIDPADSDTLPVEVRLGDPAGALYDSEGGTGFHRRIAAEAVNFLQPGGHLMLEIGETHGDEVAAVLRERGYRDVRVRQDLAGRDRFVIGERPGPGVG
jgi:release factor glutamine methyltransferase